MNTKCTSYSVKGSYLIPSHGTPSQSIVNQFRWLKAFSINFPSVYHQSRFKWKHHIIHSISQILMTRGHGKSLNQINNLDFWKSIFSSYHSIHRRLDVNAKKIESSHNIFMNNSWWWNEHTNSMFSNARVSCWSCFLFPSTAWIVRKMENVQQEKEKL